jgi:hypothetical protein
MLQFDCAAVHEKEHQRAKTVAANFQTSPKHYRNRIDSSGVHGYGAARGDRR